MNTWILFVTLVANAVLCGLQYAVQQLDLRAGRIPTRHATIAGTSQRFNYWQDAACNTWGDIIGLGLASYALVLLSSAGFLEVWQWGMFVCLCAFGAVIWYLFGTDPRYKPNWSFPETGMVSRGGWVHIAYFGLQFGVAITTLQCLVAGQLSEPAIVITLLGWAIYGLAVATDTVRGHKDRRENTHSPPILWKLVTTGRIRGTIFTGVFTTASFRLAGSEVPLGIVTFCATGFTLSHMCIMTYNDWVDRHHDRGKGKTLASDYPLQFKRYLVGLVATTLVVLFAFVFVNTSLAVFCAGTLALGIGYSYLERVFVVNNLIVATCGATPVLCGAVYAGQVPGTVWSWYAVFFALVLGREIVRDIHDHELDQTLSLKQTLSTKLGRAWAKRIAVLVTAVAGVLMTFVRKARGFTVLVAVLVYKIARWDPTSDNRRIVILYDTVLALLVLNILAWWTIFGSREVAMLDFWSAEHLLWGVVSYAFIDWCWGSRGGRTERFLTLLAVAYGWELAEYLMELGYAGTGVAEWKRGVEHWTNRYIADTWLVMLGGWVQARWPHSWKWAVGPWALWGATNYLSPTSMYIQDQILRLFP